MPFKAPIHKPKSNYQSRYDKARGSAASRGYGSAWRRLRKAKLAKDPACEWPGCMKPAEEVDHKDGNAFNREWSNLQSLCKACHTRKTNMYDGGIVRQT